MTKLIAVMAAFLALVAGSTAHAAVGDSYYRGAKNPHELAQVMRAYLKAHPNDREGKGLLAPEKCHQAHEKSCGSMWAYLMSYQHDDPSAGLTSIEQLPAYLDSLEQVNPKEVEYHMDCLEPAGADVYSVSTGCIDRRFKPGETAWENPKTHKIVFAQDCGNPVAGEVQEIVVIPTPPCITLMIRMPEGARGVHGEFASNGQITEAAQCPIFCDQNCNFTRAESDLPFVVADRRTFSLKSEGEPIVMLQVSRSFMKEGNILLVCADMGSLGLTNAARIYFHGTPPISGRVLPAKYQLPDGTIVQ